MHFLLYVLLKIKVLGSVGHPLRQTEVKVVDLDTDEILPPGSKGIVKVRGPQVMKGYYKVPLVLVISFTGHQALKFNFLTVEIM